MTRWRPAAELFGLHVDLGFYHVELDKWLRPPVARLTCRHGCGDVAVGAADVAYFTEHIDETHARTCPGPPQKEPTA
ncbi:hypothetical protein [Streptomyces soliscabiei]|uniref:hypothetical protein n=1 Tax=Streptomyces soliscabiei TaxID=588897 RepID=UPI0029A06154|nr:hypothetical protein [Streptomyces sp. NY05-11A]MDX2681076.1 hypothetical protein [Streptomyces sp. NY05-11A]